MLFCYPCLKDDKVLICDFFNFRQFILCILNTYFYNNSAIVLILKYVLSRVENLDRCFMKLLLSFI